jgi:NADPH-dependent 2,4-dienoyl-CoA reductase/sulfur reductase-like enzyme
LRRPFSFLKQSVRVGAVVRSFRKETTVSAHAIEQTSASTEARLGVVDSNSERHLADLVIFAAGVHPNADLASREGAGLGTNDAIKVTRRMLTKLPDVYAAGDCVETYHRLLDRETYIALGTIAHMQGRVAGENAIAAIDCALALWGHKASKSLSWPWRERDCSTMRRAAAASIP